MTQVAQCAPGLRRIGAGRGSRHENSSNRGDKGAGQITSFRHHFNSCLGRASQTGVTRAADTRLRLRPQCVPSRISGNQQTQRNSTL